MTTETTTEPADLVPDNGKLLRRFRREVPHRLTRDEVHDYGQKLAKSEREHATVDAAKKLNASQYTARLKEIDAEIARLTMAIESKEELRNTEVVAVLIGSQVFTKRADTGEVIDQRAATPADTQEDMFAEALELPEIAEPGSDDDAPFGHLVESSVGDAVFIGPPTDAEALDEEEKPKKKRGGGKKRGVK